MKMKILSALLQSFLLYIVAVANQHNFVTSLDTFFQHITPGSSFDNCEHPFGTRSKLLCAYLCVSSQHTCIGINFLSLGDQHPGSCQLCLAAKSYDLTQSVLSPTQESYTAATYTGYPSLSDDFYFPLDPSGLYDGQIITFRVVPGVNVIQILFLSEYSWSDTVDVNFQMKIFSQSLNMIIFSRQPSGGSWVDDNMHVASEYFTMGKESEVMAIVTESSYRLYVDGKSFPPYPRAANIALEDIVCMSISGNVKSVAWREK